jgi:hypothetical protein
MSTRGRVTANELAATYEPLNQVLTVYAKGQNQNSTFGYQFQRLTWVGGLRFELLAWSGPVYPGSTPFEYSQKFNIPNLRSIDPSGNVIIVTSNFPNGKVVPVRWLGIQAPGSYEEEQPQLEQITSLKDDKTELPEPVVTSPQTITALFKTPFELSRSDRVPEQGTIDIDFDQNYLQLQNAGIKNNNIVWTFNSVQTGRTQITVTSHGGIAQYVTQTIYDVRIIVLENSLTTYNSQSDSVLDPANAILSFLGRLNIAQRIVQARVPDAKLLSVNADLPRGIVYPVRDPLLLSQLEVVFGTQDKTIIIRSTGWGEFGPLDVRHYGTIGVRNIDISKIKVDIVEAVQLLRRKGIELSFWSAFLSWPLIAPPEVPLQSSELKIEQPHYGFRLINTDMAFVGAVDGSVNINGVGQAFLPPRDAPYAQLPPVRASSLNNKQNAKLANIQGYKQNPVQALR